MSELIPSPDELEARLPAGYRRYSGIGPYYLPVFGRVYTRRLRDCLDAARRHAGHPQRLLDAGCGLGVTTAALAQRFPTTDIVGLDIYPEEVLRYAPELNPAAQRATFVSGSVEALPFPDRDFDVVTAFDVLEHVPDPERALAEIARVLRPGGVVVVSVPIESHVLRTLRWVALAGGRKGSIHPHWEGAIPSLAAFEQAWQRHFAPLEVFNTPVRWSPRLLNYDVILVGRQ